MGIGRMISASWRMGRMIRGIVLREGRRSVCGGEGEGGEIMIMIKIMIKRGWACGEEECGYFTIDNS